MRRGNEFEGGLSLAHPVISPWPTHSLSAARPAKTEVRASRQGSLPVQFEPCA